ncbi:two-component regulator propeller domain-containing protein [Luteolibacter sp. LG18]|uniref:sensor histidine kinase n=1 Tax=Luteolibacter sp. LG18 TaxID=2819286 RepID=UPI0030C72E44
MSAGAAEPVSVDMLYRNWRTREGLPQDHIRVMAGTRDGFLWLGTDAGLARFDGVRFKAFGMHDGLGAITVLCLYQSLDSTLWVGTQGGGVSRVRDGKIERTYDLGAGLPSNSILGIAEDDSGHPVVATLGGLVRLEGASFVPFDVPSSNPRQVARTLFHARDGTLWVGFQNNEIWRWKAGQWIRGSEGGPTSAQAFCQDLKGRLWVGDSTRRLWCLEQGTWSSRPLPILTGDINTMAAAPDGTVWISMYRRGICGWKDDTFVTPVPGGAKFLDIAETVFVSPDGQLWVGTSTRGLFALTPRKVELGIVDESTAGPGANFIGALLEVAPGEFLIGSQGRGYYLWRNGTALPMESDVEIKANTFGNAAIRTIQGRVFAGGSGGVYEYLNGKLVRPQKPERLIPDVWTLCEDRPGSLWAGSGQGVLYHIAGGKIEEVGYGGRFDPIKGLAVDKKGALWIGTRGNNGLYRLVGSESKRFGVEQGMPKDAVIRVLHIDRNDTLWVGTAGSGLVVRHGDRFSTFSTREGLPDDVVSQITVDDTGRLWVGTNRGMAVFTAEETAALREGRAAEIHPLFINRADGLRSEECTITPPIRTSDGRMAFATNDGFVLLKPSDFQGDTRTPPVFIEEVYANGKLVEPVAGSLELPPGIERLEIHFTGLHFGAPERLKFRNRLAGLENGWGDASTERRVEYRNLAPGKYRFELSGTIGNGLWSQAPAILEINLAPHFWETGWFRALVVISALALVGWIVRRRERMRAQRKIEALKREQAIQNERARIARDLHDDVGASLTQVALLSELAQGDLTQRPERASAHINEIFTTAQDVTRSLDEIVWAVNPAHDTLESFVTFLGAFVQNYTRSAGLAARLDLPATLPPLPLSSAIRHHVYLATKEILHNVVKHAWATEVHLSLSLQPGSFRLMLEDNGRGSVPAQTPSPGGADGLPNLQERLQQIGGTCVYDSRPGEGTRVEMNVPLDPPP